MSATLGYSGKIAFTTSDGRTFKWMSTDEQVKDLDAKGSSAERRIADIAKSVSAQVRCDRRNRDDTDGEQ